MTSLPASIHQAAHNLAVWDNDPRWRDDAACRGENPDLFFPTRGEDSSRAKSVCAHCPAITECAEYGMHEKHGIWGGMSERERRRERQRRRLPEPPADDMDKRLDQLAARLHATRLAAAALTIIGHHTEAAG